jgi:serine protease Do
MIHTPSPCVHRTIRGLFLLAVCASLRWTTPAHAQWRWSGDTDVVLKTDPKFLAAFREVVAGAARSTVRVRRDGKDAALGAVVGADGWILTKASELKGDLVCRLRDGRDLPARIMGVQESYDLAMLKIEAKGLTPVAWRESKDVPVGNWLATPAMGDDPVAVGVLSVEKRKVGKIELERPSSSAGFLGIEIDPAKKAVTIKRVIPLTAAAKAKLKADDRIVAISDKPITDRRSLFDVLEKKRPGEVVIVRVQRGDEELELKATLGERPPDYLGRSDFQNQLGSKLSYRRTGFPVILQHDTVLRPSDCGGPVVDLDGKVIGINIARAGRTETYAIPAEVVKTLLADLKSGKLAPKK